MHLYAQHGAQAGNKIISGLQSGVLDGVIFGAKEISGDRLRSEATELAKGCPGAARLFDPQYYATFIASQSGARLGYLSGENEHGYFRAHLRRDLERLGPVRDDIRACLQYQAGLSLTALIAPNIVVRRSLDSIEGVIAKNFVRLAGEIAEKVAPGSEVYATLAISYAALADKSELQNFLQDVTELDHPPTGFYLLSEKPDSTPLSSLSERDALARWMLVNHALKVSGFRVINGYTDLIAPYVGATGADAAASGWFNTLKIFSLEKFEPNSGFKNRPSPRYTSAALLKSIRHTELDDLRSGFTDLLNGLPSDVHYSEEQGSLPDATGEAVQNWAALKEINRRCAGGADVRSSLAACNAALESAEARYAAINMSGYTLRDRSNDEHIVAIREELAEFRTLAEL